MKGTHAVLCSLIVAAGLAFARDSFANSSTFSFCNTTYANGITDLHITLDSGQQLNGYTDPGDLSGDPATKQMTYTAVSGNGTNQVDVTGVSYAGSPSQLSITLSIAGGGNPSITTCGWTQDGNPLSGKPAVVLH